MALLFVCAASPGRTQEAGPLPPSRPLPSPDVGAAPVSPARTGYLPLLSSEARQHGLPPEVADAVARVESGYDPTVVGGVGERGLMQVLPSTAAMLGFHGTPAELADPATNIRLGVTYLSQAWKLAHGDLCRTLMKYRAGHNEERMSALSVEYCRRAKNHLATLGSPLAAGPLPKAEFGTAPAASGEAALAGYRIRRVAGRLRRASPVRTAATSRRFWKVHMARVAAIEARLPWKHGGILARN